MVENIKGTMAFPIQTTPYLRLFRRLFRGQGSLESISYKQDILHPEEKATLSSTVFLPGQIERIKEYKATDSWGAPTRDLEIAAATSTTIVHPPTIAYHIKDAVLFDGVVYVGTSSIQLPTNRCSIHLRTNRSTWGRAHWPRLF